jgi:hypothetical protein
MIRDIKHFYQRAKKGYSSRDVWNMNSYLISIIIPMLKELKEGKLGYPGTEGAKTPEEWEQRLDEMIEGFEAGKRFIDDDYMEKIQPGWLESIDTFEQDNSGHLLLKSNVTDESWKKYLIMVNEDEEKFHGGFKIFEKYFFHLWD